MDYANSVLVYIVLGLICNPYSGYLDKIAMLTLDTQNKIAMQCLPLTLDEIEMPTLDN